MSERPTPLSNRRPRRWWQYGLRSLLLLVFVAALVAKYLSGPEVLEEPGPQDAHRVVRQVIRDRDNNPVNHGTWIMYDPAGSKLVEGAYRNGQPHGWWTYWHAVVGQNAEFGTRNGETAQSSTATAAPVHRRSMQGRYERGKREGTWTAWYPTGHKQWEIDYAAGEPVGAARHWDAVTR